MSQALISWHHSYLAALLAAVGAGPVGSPSTLVASAPVPGPDALEAGVVWLMQVVRRPDCNTGITASQLTGSRAPDAAAWGLIQWD